ncbi:hypothetical protein ACH4T9_31790 [Micromonospora sp. NPDC020750]|uniref:hypothetical protein n=1 Tax=unclassified Micromonospora TaxID=2617518 RepID=UPI0037A3E8FE
MHLLLREHMDSSGAMVAFEDDKPAVTYGDPEARTRQPARGIWWASVCGVATG